MQEYVTMVDDDAEAHKPFRGKKYKLPVSENIYTFEIGRAHV